MALRRQLFVHGQFVPNVISRLQLLVPWCGYGYLSEKKSTFLYLRTHPSCFDMISASMAQMAAMMLGLASPAAALQVSVANGEERRGCPKWCDRASATWKACSDCDFDDPIHFNKNHVAMCENIDEGTPSAGFQPVPELPAYAAAVKTLDVSAVISDLREVMKASKDCWPADWGHYGPLFVRLAWHCSGTYRITDGKGGCAGGRLRFSPEASWPDNTNLDKARALLVNIKQKYGDALSWGDLMTLSGTASMWDMGFPVKQWCAGRLDDMTGGASEILGPSEDQEQATPCDTPGRCQKPLGSVQVGLIYVNPEGPASLPTNPWEQGVPQPVPEKSALSIKEVFGRMGMNASETVALIGGGHAFGKAHGACPDGPGRPPSPKNTWPWKGNCGTGAGEDTFTSGLEGQWTDKPTKWDNTYFQYMLDLAWELGESPAGAHQWHVKDCEGDQCKLMMFTSDLALGTGEFKAISEQFARDQSSLDVAFDAAWYKLTHSGGTWSESKFCYQFPPPPKCDDELLEHAITMRSDDAHPKEE